MDNVVTVPGVQDLAGDAAAADLLGQWRQRMVDELTGRPEGFVSDAPADRQDPP